MKSGREREKDCAREKRKKIKGSEKEMLQSTKGREREKG